MAREAQPSKPYDKGTLGGEQSRGPYDEEFDASVETSRTREPSPRTAEGHARCEDLGSTAPTNPPAWWERNVATVQHGTREIRLGSGQGGIRRPTCVRRRRRMTVAREAVRGMQVGAPEVEHPPHRALAHQLAGAHDRGKVPVLGHHLVGDPRPPAASPARAPGGGRRPGAFRSTRACPPRARRARHSKWPEFGVQTSVASIAGSATTERQSVLQRGTSASCAPVAASRASTSQMQVSRGRGPSGEYSRGIDRQAWACSRPRRPTPTKAMPSSLLSDHGHPFPRARRYRSQGPGRGGPSHTRTWSVSRVGLDPSPLSWARKSQSRGRTTQASGRLLA